MGQEQWMSKPLRRVQVQHGKRLAAQVIQDSRNVEISLSLPGQV